MLQFRPRSPWYERTTFELNARKRKRRECWSSKFDEIVFQKEIHCSPNLERRVISVYIAYYSNRFLSSTGDRIVATARFTTLIKCAKLIQADDGRSYFRARAYPAISMQFIPRCCSLACTRANHHKSSSVEIDTSSGNTRGSCARLSPSLSRFLCVLISGRYRGTKACNSPRESILAITKGNGG